MLYIYVKYYRTQSIFRLCTRSNFYWKNTRKNNRIMFLFFIPSISFCFWSQRLRKPICEQLIREQSKGKEREHFNNKLSLVLLVLYLIIYRYACIHSYSSKIAPRYPLKIEMKNKIKKKTNYACLLCYIWCDYYYCVLCVIAQVLFNFSLLFFHVNHSENALANDCTRTAKSM